MVVKYPLATEKSIRLMESENKLVFVVDRRDRKPDIKKNLEETFQVKILNINTHIGQDGKKRVYVQFGPETPALDIATKLGMM